jgi:hypothetical protein
MGISLDFLPFNSSLSFGKIKESHGAECNKKRERKAPVILFSTRKSGTGKAKSAVALP